MATPPAGRAFTSSWAVSGFRATRISESRLQAKYPSLLARIKNQVGCPAILEGKRFFPLAGTPIPKMLFSRTLLADCEPEPFTVATLMLKSFVTRCRVFVAPCASSKAGLPVAIWRDSLQINSDKVNLSLNLDYSHRR